MVTRILHKPLEQRKSFFLLGPRATGKTFWIKQNLPNAIYIDLLDMEIYTRLLAHPENLKDFIPKGYRDWIILDEIQRVPALLNEVHRLIESEGHIFILTGSSARNLRKKGVNLLAGRALVYHLYPLLPQEVGESFNLNHTLTFGLLPAILSELEPAIYLKSYVTTYLREEVLQEGLTRNLSAFSRFLEIASFSHGQVLNISGVARESGLNQKSVSNYFDILDDLLIAYRLPIFKKRAKRQVIQHPKFYFFDVGVYQTLRPRGYIDSRSEIDGAALEGLLLQSLRAINDYYNLDYQLSYWRTTAGAEVDFILYGPNGFHAFEIKHSSQVSRKETKGLLAFYDDYPEAKLYLIYGGNQKLYFDHIEVWPMRDLLFQLPAILKLTPSVHGHNPA